MDLVDQIEVSGGVHDDCWRGIGMFGRVRRQCGKRFEIPSHRGLVFLEELEGLPQEDYDE